MGLSVAGRNLSLANRCPSVTPQGDCRSGSPISALGVSTVRNMFRGSQAGQSFRASYD